MTMEKTTSAARGKWRGILTHFGMDPKFLDGEHGPCPFDGGKDRWRWDDKDGSGSYYCSGCEPRAGSGMAVLMRLKGWDFPTAAKAVDGVLGLVHKDERKQERNDEQKQTAIRNLLKHSLRVAPGMPPWIYLENRCGDPTGYVQDLKYKADLRYAGESPATYPAMLAILRYADGKGASVHKTFLTLDGRKANLDPVRKLTHGFPVEGAAVRLGSLQERLGIGEGIETCISASKIFGLPVWSGLSANGILSWVPPEGVRSVLICADNDAHKNYEGQVAAYEKAKKLKQAGLDVDVVVPLIPGQDWNDVWLKSEKVQVA